MPRKQPYSGKQKKKQLQERRNRKQGPRGVYGDDAVHVVCDEGTAGGAAAQSSLDVQRLNQQPAVGKDFDPNRFRLHFLKITPEEMERRKRAARRPLVKVTEADLELSVESVHGADASLDFPKRPPWNFSLTKTQLEKQELAYFQEYLQTMLTSHELEKLSFFELNLETWRQFWRVMEISDVLLLIADIRYPVLHLPPRLYSHMQHELKRDLVLVLNKVDLAPPPLVAAWRAYLAAVYPEARIVCFTSFPKPPEESASGLQKKRKRSTLKPSGPQELLDACRELVKDRVDLETWQRKLDTEDTDTSAPDKHSEDDKAAEAGGDSTHIAESFHPGVYQRFRDGILTIGCIGYPNVGKSSLLNGLIGKKVVSVSKTPGHTKHLQTIFLTPTVRLCDCPGLVFPSYVDKSLQVLSGIYPIAQVREPYSAVAYLARRLDLPKLLRLSHPAAAEQSAKPGPASDLRWSAFDICEAWAIKNGFFTAKASRPDVYRAANLLLRMGVEGRLRLCLAPPDYFRQQERWSQDPFAVHLSELLKKPTQSADTRELASESETDDEESNEDRSEDDDDDDDNDAAADSTPSCARNNPFALLADD